MSMTEDTNDFDLSDLDYSDEATMTVVIRSKSGKTSEWKWTFAGPGHPKSIEQANRIARERLHRDRAQEQARVNGKTWTPPEESLDEVRSRNIKIITDRLLGWSEFKFNGEVYPFSPENAYKLLSQPKKGDLLKKAIEFLNDDAAFTTRSAGA
jgi:hypothetical protein